MEQHSSEEEGDNMKLIPLNKDNSSWVRTFVYNDRTIDSKAFNEIWDLHPPEQDIIMFFGKPVKMPRFQQTFGEQGYNFSGVKHSSVPIPPLLQPFLDYANRVCSPYLKSYKQGFNMLLINWYENGSNYIGAHSDSETQLLKNKKGEVLVFSLSFGATRSFRLHPKNEEDKAGSRFVELELTNNTGVLMGGLCQTTHKHSVPKIDGKKGLLVGKRINVTCRIFKEEGAPKVKKGKKAIK